MDSTSDIVVGALLLGAAGIGIGIGVVTAVVLVRILRRWLRDDD